MRFLQCFCFFYDSYLRILFLFICTFIFILLQPHQLLLHLLVCLHIRIQLSRPQFFPACLYLILLPFILFFDFPYPFLIHLQLYFLIPLLLFFSIFNIICFIYLFPF